MTQRLMLAGLGFLLVTGLVLLLVTRSPEPPQPPPAAAADTLPGTRAPGSAADSGFIGVVVAHGSVDIAASFAGRMEHVDVRVGNKVRKGSVLARQDVRSLQHELSITQAGLQAARADEEVAQLSLTQAQETLRRGGDPKLVSLGALSAEELAKLSYAEKMAVAKLRAAQAQVFNQQARVEQLQLRISEATLRAPFDATVSMRYLDPGTTVNTGTAVVRLLSDGPQVVRFAIPEEASERVRVGSRVRLEVRGQEHARHGRVDNVSPEVDAASRMVLAMASVDSDEGASLPFGSVVRVVVDEGERVGRRSGE